MQVIGAPLAAALLYMDGLGHLRGWQWLFIIEGCLTSIYGVILKVSAHKIVYSWSTLLLGSGHWLRERRHSSSMHWGQPGFIEHHYEVEWGGPCIYS